MKNWLQKREKKRGSERLPVSMLGHLPTHVSRRYRYRPLYLNRPRSIVKSRSEAHLWSCMLHWTALSRISAMTLSVCVICIMKEKKIQYVPRLCTRGRDNRPGPSPVAVVRGISCLYTTCEPPLKGTPQDHPRAVSWMDSLSSERPCNHPLSFAVVYRCLGNARRCNPAIHTVQSGKMIHRTCWKQKFELLTCRYLAIMCILPVTELRGTTVCVTWFKA